MEMANELSAMMDLAVTWGFCAMGISTLLLINRGMK